MIPENYRANVGIMIMNTDGLLWMGKRINGESLTHPWQMPQGGIDKGETPIEAAWRELYEETGLTKKTTTLVAESKQWLCYKFPEWVKLNPFIGQCQRWFLFQFTGENSDFQLDVHPEEIEFSEFQWVLPEKVHEMIVPFKKEVYQNILQEFKPLFIQK